MPHRIWSWYTGRCWVGCYIWYSEEGTGRGRSPPSPLLTVPNVTAHPSTASVPITVLLYNDPLLWGFSEPIKRLTELTATLSRRIVRVTHLSHTRSFAQDILDWMLVNRTMLLGGVMAAGCFIWASNVVVNALFSSFFTQTMSTGNKKLRVQLALHGVHKNIKPEKF